MLHTYQLNDGVSSTKVGYSAATVSGAFNGDPDASPALPCAFAAAKNDPSIKYLMELGANEYQRRGLQFDNENGMGLVNEKCRRGERPSREFLYVPKCLAFAAKTGKWCSWEVMLSDYYEDDLLVKKSQRLKNTLGVMDVFLDEYLKPRCTFPAPQSLCHLPLG